MVRRIISAAILLSLLSVPLHAGNILFYNDFEADTIGSPPVTGDPPYSPEGDYFTYNPKDYARDSEISTVIRGTGKAMLMWNKSSTNGQSFNTSGRPVLVNELPYSSGIIRVSVTHKISDPIPANGGPYFYLLTGQDSTTNPLTVITTTSSPNSDLYVRTRNTSGAATWKKAMSFTVGVEYKFAFEVNLDTSTFSFFVNGAPVVGCQGIPTSNENYPTNFLGWKFTSSVKNVNRFMLDDIMVESVDPSEITPDRTQRGGLNLSGTADNDSISLYGGADASRAVFEIPIDSVTATPSLATFSFSAEIFGATSKLSQTAPGLELRHFTSQPDGALNGDDFDADDSKTESLGVVLPDVSTLSGKETISVDVTEAVARDFDAGFLFSGFQLRLTDENESSYRLDIDGSLDGPSAPKLSITAPPPADPSPYDFTRDGNIDAKDILQLMHHDRNRNTASGDLSGDGKLNYEDYLLMGTQWQE